MGYICKALKVAFIIVRQTKARESCVIPSWWQNWDLPDPKLS